MKATCPEHVTNGSRNSWLSSVELRNLKPNVRAVLSPNLLWRQASNQHCQPGAENLPVAHLPQQVGVPRQFIAELIRGRGMDHLTADPQRAAQPARRDPSLMHYKCPSTAGFRGLLHVTASSFGGLISRLVASRPIGGVGRAKDRGGRAAVPGRGGRGSQQVLH